MADYLYYSPIYTDTTTVSNPLTDNATHLTDYEANYQSQVGKVDNVSLAATTFYFPMDFDDFKDLISDPITWADVKELETDNRYVLYIISNTEL